MAEVKIMVGGRQYGAFTAAMAKRPSFTSSLP